MKSVLVGFGWVLAFVLGAGCLYFYQLYNEASGRLDELVTECAELVVRVEQQALRNQELADSVADLSTELSDAQDRIQAMLQLLTEGDREDSVRSGPPESEDDMAPDPPPATPNEPPLPGPDSP